MRPGFRQQGWLLVGLIVLISTVILALAGITFFLTEHLRTTSLRQNQTKAIYLAQAGVMRAIYDFRTNAGVLLGVQTVEAGPSAGPLDDNVYILGGKAADFLLVNLLNPSWSPAKECSLNKRDRFD